MSAQAQICLWGAAVLMPLFLNSLMRRGPDALGLSSMLAMIWAFERVMWALWAPPDCMRLYPIIDAVAGATAFTAWLTRRKPWKLCLSLLFLAECGLHFDFWLAWPANANLYSYILMNNLLFAAQLLFAASPGVLSVVLASGLVGSVPGRARTVHYPGA